MFKKLQLKIFIFAFLAYSNIVSAKNSYITNAFDWTSDGNYYSSTTFLTPIDLSKESYFITSKIALNMDGSKRLYFDIYKMAGNGSGAIDICNKNDYEQLGEDAFVKDKIWSFNGQNIKMVVFCTPSSVDGRLYMQATSRTSEGHNFIKEALISESKNIIVDSDILKFEISPRGFSKRWRASSNAL